MMTLKSKLIAFLKDEEGLTMTEYAVAGGLIVVGAVGAFTLLGGNITLRITEIAGHVLGTP